MADTPSLVRLGILGAARIVPMALIAPAADMPEIAVSAIAARDESRAASFARKHGIPQIYPSYERLLADPAIDAVYIPLPNALHYEWGLRALAAGKHVLCEKPLASNAEQAQQMAEAARKAGRILAEGMHYRYHPLAARVAEIVRGGAIGAIRHIEARISFPVLPLRSTRYAYELGGGSMMDLGCYAVDFVRFIAGGEPKVIGAKARLASEKVDRSMMTDLRFDDGATARVTCSFWFLGLPRGDVVIQGSRGELKVTGPYSAHPWHSVTLSTDGETKQEHRRGLRSTYSFQLQAFADAVIKGTPMVTDAASAVGTMRIIDAAYGHAGLPPRGV